jgi:hypothetical protein
LTNILPPVKDFLAFVVFFEAPHPHPKNPADPYSDYIYNVRMISQKFNILKTFLD